jgi:hypothetical protein
MVSMCGHTLPARNDPPASVSKKDGVAVQPWETDRVLNAGISLALDKLVGQGQFYPFGVALTRVNLGRNWGGFPSDVKDANEWLQRDRAGLERAILALRPAGANVGQTWGDFPDFPSGEALLDYADRVFTAPLDR